MDYFRSMGGGEVKDDGELSRGGMFRRPHSFLTLVKLKFELPIRELNYEVLLQESCRNNQLFGKSWKEPQDITVSRGTYHNNYR